jgi:hypothetical protein
VASRLKGLSYEEKLLELDLPTLEERRYYTHMPEEKRNQIPSQVNNVKTVISFNHGYKTYKAGLVPPT